jgi:hypothetical protein
MERPSWGELSKKIQQANELISANAINIIDPTVIAADAIELGYQIRELQKVLLTVLGEITPKEYAGTRPPQKSYREQITGSELYAFRWKSGAPPTGVGGTNAPASAKPAEPHLPALIMLSINAAIRRIANTASADTLSAFIRQPELAAFCEGG